MMKEKQKEELLKKAGEKRDKNGYRREHLEGDERAETDEERAVKEKDEKSERKEGRKRHKRR